ncbi:hypothetical protein AX14_002170 [Amanita brunnescens Koide BX004]|nr:hypothetical protein AX14_002170 [Amanita brunnescens Koide BX004]
MSYVIFGRAIKNEHISLGVLTTAFGGAWLATRGGKKSAPPQSVEQARASVPLNASSNEEEEFMKNFIAAAEKDDGHAKH